MFVIFFCSPLFAQAQEILPDFYSEPGAGGNKRQGASSAPNEVIDPFSGSLSIVHTDLVLPGNGGLDITVQRSYSSNNVYFRAPGQLGASLTELNETTPYGVGWSLHFGRIRTSNPFELEDACTSSFSPSNDLSASNNPVLEMPDGTQKQLFCNDGVFENSINADFITKDNWAVYVNTNNAGVSGFEVYDTNGVKYTIDKQLIGGTALGVLIPEQFVWYTTNIEDQNGNEIDIRYRNDDFSDGAAFREGESPIFRDVISNDGRRVIFTYSRPNDPNNAQLTHIEYDGANNTGRRRISYTFNSNFSPDYQTTRNYRLLTRVNFPEPNSTAGRWEYSYYTSRRSGDAGDNMLQTITYPGGAETTYDYDYECFLYESCERTSQYFSLVVKSKENRGAGITAGTWTFDYDTASNESFGVTTIYGPNFNEEYRHHRLARITALQNSGLGLNLREGNLWRIGLLNRKRTFARNGNSRTSHGALLQTETTTYGSRVLSTERYERFPYSSSLNGVFDNEVYQHFVTSRTINRDGEDYITQYSNFADGLNPHTMVERGQENRTTNLTYYPRRNRQNIAHLIDDERINNSNIANRRILRTFNNRGLLTDETRYGVRTRYSYNSNGTVSRMIDARNNTIDFSNYKLGIARTEERPEDVLIVRDVDDFGNVTREVDGRGLTTRYTYDGLDRLRSIDMPIGNDIAITWTPTRRTLNRGSYRQITSMDGFGRPTCIENRSSDGTVFFGQGYDAVGNKVYSDNVNYSRCNFGDQTRYTYDGLNRLSRTTHPDNTFQQITYLSNNRQRIRDERNISTTNSYRSYSNPDEQELIAVSVPNALSYTVARNILGQPTRVTRNGVIRSYNYGSSYFILSENNPETGVTTYGRDNLGNMTSRRVGASDTTTFRYDGLNRLEFINYPQGTPDTTMQYDGNDNVTNVTSGITDFIYSYDSNNNLVRERQIINDLVYDISYTFNGLDDLTAMTYPDNGRVTYAPNEFGWPTQVAPYVTNVTYNAAGQPTLLEYANGRRTAHSYTVRRWPNITTVNGGIFNRQRTYDGAGNLLTADDRLDDTYDRTLSYDPLGRLRTATGGWGNNGLITYNGDDSILLKRMGSRSSNYTYSQTNRRVTNVTGLTDFNAAATFAYDAYGNITRKSSGNQGWTYDYDDAPNLREVSSQAGELLRRYDYSGEKQRVRSISPDETRIHIVNKEGHIINEFIVGSGLNGGPLSPDRKPEIANVYLGNRLVAELEHEIDASGSAGGNSDLGDGGNQGDLLSYLIPVLYLLH